MNKVYYIGLDVHKDSIAYTNSESRVEAIFYGTCGSGITTAERKLRKLVKKLEVTLQTSRFAMKQVQLFLFS